MDSRFADFIVPRNKRNTIGFFCFAFDKKMPLGKPTFFCIRYFSKTKQNIAKKKAGHCLIHLNKRKCQIWSCFGQCSISAKNHYRPFSTEPFNSTLRSVPIFYNVFHHSIGSKQSVKFKNGRRANLKPKGVVVRRQVGRVWLRFNLKKYLKIFRKLLGYLGSFGGFHRKNWEVPDRIFQSIFSDFCINSIG